MGVNKRYEILKQALNEYYNKEGLYTERHIVSCGNHEWACFGVFDLPSDFNPELGLLQDDPEYRAKPILTARITENGDVAVEETEYTAKYMKRNPPPEAFADAAPRVRSDKELAAV